MIKVKAGYVQEKKVNANKAKRNAIRTHDAYQSCRTALRDKKKTSNRKVQHRILIQGREV
jgi:hypothetical protein